MTNYNVEVEFIPESSYEDIEWGWEAKVTERDPDDDIWHLNETKEISSKFSYPTLEEARDDFNTVITPYIKALNREDRVETRQVEA